MRKIALLLFVFLVSLPGFSQNLDADSYDSEFIWGINKNTSGGFIGGFMLRSSRKINDRLYQSIGFELVNVKHAQEIRRRSIITGNFFIFGKSNYLYAIRGQYGRELIVFKKASQQGVEVKAVVAIGPSIGILAPYYIQYALDANGTTKYEQYDPKNSKHLPEGILGSGHVLQGIEESQIKLGGNLKAALSFELGTLKSHVTGFEAGFLIDAYTDKILLMPTAENRSIFPTAFITLFYGKRR